MTYCHMKIKREKIPTTLEFFMKRIKKSHTKSLMESSLEKFGQDKRPYITDFKKMQDSEKGLSRASMNKFMIDSVLMMRRNQNLTIFSL